jgi:hypothetical protein
VTTRIRSAAAVEGKADDRRHCELRREKERVVCSLVQFCSVHHTSTNQHISSEPTTLRHSIAQFDHSILRGQLLPHLFPIFFLSACCDPLTLFSLPCGTVQKIMSLESRGGRVRQIIGEGTLFCLDLLCLGLCLLPLRADRPQLIVARLSALFFFFLFDLLGDLLVLFVTETLVAAFCNFDFLFSSLGILSLFGDRVGGQLSIGCP